MIADLILIPFVLFLSVGFKTAKNEPGKIFFDYMSPANTSIMKGIFAIVVVCYHLGLVINGMGSKILVHLSGDFAVKMFFFYSGYGLLIQYKKALSREQNYLHGFILKKMPRLLVPLLTATVIYALYFNKYHGYYGQEDFTLKVVAKLFVENGLYVVYNSWFVFELLVLYIVFYLSFKFVKDYSKALKICIFGLCAVMLGFYCVSIHKGWSIFWFYSTFAFAIGILFADNKERIDIILLRHYDRILLILLPTLICSALFFWSLKIGVEDTTGIIAAENIALCPLFVLAVTLVSARIKPGCSKIWSFLGKISYEIYLIHGFFYYVFITGDFYVENKLYYVCIVMICSIGAAIVLHCINTVILRGYNFLIDKILFSEKKVKA